MAADESFKFIVFGDFNSGDCYRNDRVQRTINMMAKEYLNQIPHQAVPKSALIDCGLPVE